MWATDGVQNITLFVGDEDVTIDGLPMWQQPATVTPGKPLTVVMREPGGFYGATGRVVLRPVNGTVTLTLTELPCYVTKQTPFTQESIMPGNQFQFLPPQMTVAAGEPNDVGFRVANVGDRQMVGKLVIRSKHIVPGEIEFNLAPKAKSLLIAKINTPDGAPGDTLHIPAEVMVDGRLTAQLELLVKLGPPASIEITPDPAVPGRALIEIESRKTSRFGGKVIVTSSPPAEPRTQELPFEPIDGGMTARVAAPIALADAPQDTLYSVTARVIADKGPPVEQTRRLSFLTCRRAKSPITIDGKLDEWKDSAPIRLDRREQITTGADTWKGADDSAGAVYTMWDDLWFYIAARVRDNVRSTVEWGERIYNNDGIEFYFDNDLRGDRGERKYSGDDSQYGCFNSPRGAVVWNWQPEGGPSKGSKCAFVYEESLGPGGYVIEAKIPLPEIGLMAKIGKTIGFSVALNDDDSPGRYDAFRQERQFSWTGSKENWLDPTQFAQITLAE